MRTYILVVVFGLLLTALLGLQLLASPAIASTIEADVDIAPNVLNLKRTYEPSGVITAYVSNLRDEGNSYDASDIDVSTLGLYYGEDLVVEALRASVENDVLIVKFDACTVANYIWSNIVYHMGTVPPQANETITLMVKGQLISTGEVFAGSDTIKIILP